MGLTYESSNMIKYIFSLLVLLLSFNTQGQDILYKDHIYLEHIKSVQLNHNSLETSEPIIDLNSGQLVLSFDDILGGDRTYTYRIVHCDKDWQPSENISEMDFLDGFNDEDIRDYEYSSGTIYDYTNYKLTLPNRDCRWRISGNYVLIVTDDDSDEIALTRRFMVAERKVSIGVEFSRSRRPGRTLKDQELEITIDNERYPISNPQNELFMTVMQNGRWDNIKTNIQPRVALRNVISFDRTTSISFPAYNEFRGADLRTFRTRGLGVYSIDIYEDEINILLDLDRKRGNVLLQNYEDINGDFIIETSEYPNSRFRSEYVNTIFSIESEQQFRDADVFVVGAFSDWEPREEHRLKYDPQHKVYSGTSLLKQGYYDYQYMIKYDDGTLDCEHFEGSNFGTDNQYHVLVYQRNYKERYDRLIAVRAVSSGFGG